MKMMLLLFVLATTHVFAHGENKPGPHGGHIRMPGRFHTELVLDTQSAKIYLLDIRLSNPTTENSNVNLVLNADGKSKNISCVKKQEYFECPVPSKLAHLSEIRIKAVRNGVTGKEAKYPLPLSFPQTHH